MGQVENMDDSPKGFACEPSNCLIFKGVAVSMKANKFSFSLYHGRDVD